MADAAHNPAFARKMGIPQNVAKEFNQADTGTPMLRRANSVIRHQHGLHHFPHKSHNRNGR